MTWQTLAIVSLLATTSCEGPRPAAKVLPNFRAACSAAANKPAANLTPLKLQLPWFPNGEHSYNYLGKSLGIFTAHGFDVEIVTGKGSDIAARALAVGNVDAAIIGGDALVLVNQEGGDIRSIGAVYQETPVVIYSLAERGIDKDPTKLYGRSLGLLPGSNTVTQYEGIANALQLDRSKITEVTVQPPLAAGMILKGRGVPSNPNDASMLDALVHYTQFAPLETTTNNPDVKLSQISLAKDLGVKIYGMTRAVQAGELSDNQLTHLKQAVYDSFQCAKAGPEASIEALAEANPGAEFGPSGKDRKYATAQLAAMLTMACEGIDRGPKCEGFLSQDKGYWGETIKTLVRFGLLKKPVDTGTVMQDVDILTIPVA